MPLETSLRAFWRLWCAEKFQAWNNNRQEEINISSILKNRSIKLLIWPRGDLQKPQDVAWIQSGSPRLWAFKPPLAENRIHTEAVRCVSGWVSGPHFGPICQMGPSLQSMVQALFRLRSQQPGGTLRMNCKAITASATQGRCEDKGCGPDSVR